MGPLGDEACPKDGERSQNQIMWLKELGLFNLEEKRFRGQQACLEKGNYTAVSKDSTRSFS